MPLVSPLKEFTFKYDSFGCKTPRVPVRFERSDGQSTPVINAILDSGSDQIVIRKDLAVWLGITLTHCAQQVATAGGILNSFKGITPKFILGRGGREVIWKDIEIRVIENNPAFLIGIDPVFEVYLVTIDASSKKFTLTPKS